MLKKTCPKCGTDSYSSTTHGLPWLCPRCKEDLSEIEALNPEPPVQTVAGRTGILSLLKRLLK